LKYRQGLIAINYPARAFGLNRHVTISEAKKLCPDLICQHVATWREGDEKWAYHDDAYKNIATHKVSLDPYRLESRRILACIKECLPKNLQKVEKASVDEVFMDLSAQVHMILLERYPELKGPAPYDDVMENLPIPPTTVLDWKADALVDLDTNETEDDDPDWDDIALLIGSEIVRAVRAAIREKLKYTCSAGIAQNKMLAKLGSAHKKPSQQTVIRNRAVQQFLSGFKFTKIRNLGGKMGEEVVKLFNTDMVKDLLLVSMEQMKQKLGEETGTWVYNAIRGIDHSEVNSRTQIKSMLSAKSFRPSINTPEQANKWLRIFAADIYSRLVEEGVLENKRRPKTINLHHRHGGQTKSRQAPISQGKKIDETLLFELAKNLLNQIMLEGRVWPCANLSLSVGGFEDGVSGNMGIGAFLVKGEEARALNSTSSRDVGKTALGERPDKRRRVGDAGIQKFFAKTESVEEHDDDFGGEEDLSGAMVVDEQDVVFSDAAGSNTPEEDEANIGLRAPSGAPAMRQPQITMFLCSRCNQSLPSPEALQSHEDWHFAKDLQDEDRSKATSPAPPSTSSGSKRGTLRKRGNGRGGRPEKGQSKLTFG
jgi:DNA polymerase eta